MEKLPQQEIRTDLEAEKKPTEIEVINTLGRIGMDLEEAGEPPIKKTGKSKTMWIRNTIDGLTKKYPAYSEFITSLVIGPDPEWSQITTHLTLANKDHPEIMKRFWEIYYIRRPDDFEANRHGIVAQSKAIQIFQELGLDVRQATPKEDKSKKISNLLITSPTKKTIVGADFFLNDTPVQVKSGLGTPGIFIARKGNPDGTQYLHVKINSEQYGNPYTGKPDREIIEIARKKFEEIGLLPK